MFMLLHSFSGYYRCCYVITRWVMIMSMKNTQNSHYVVRLSRTVDLTSTSYYAAGRRLWSYWLNTQLGQTQTYSCIRCPFTWDWIVQKPIARGYKHKNLEIPCIVNNYVISKVIKLCFSGWPDLNQGVVPSLVDACWFSWPGTIGLRDGDNPIL
jgi:hypothetical protein